MPLLHQITQGMPPGEMLSNFSSKEEQNLLRRTRMGGLHYSGQPTVAIQVPYNCSLKEEWILIWQTVHAVCFIRDAYKGRYQNSRKFKGH